MYQFFILGWSKCPFWFFCTLKETFFIFTNNFIDLDILSMSAISCYWLLVCRGQGCNQTSSNPKDSSTAKCYLAKMSIVLRNFPNHFWHVQSVTAPSLYTAQIFYCFAFQLCFYLSWNNKAKYTKNVEYFISSLILKWLHKNSPILIF